MKQMVFFFTWTLQRHNSVTSKNCLSVLTFTLLEKKKKPNATDIPSNAWCLWKGCIRVISIVNSGDRLPQHNPSVLITIAFVTRMLKVYHSHHLYRCQHIKMFHVEFYLYLLFICMWSIYIYTYIYTYIHTYIHIHAYIRTYVQRHIRTWVCMWAKYRDNSSG